jgi:hypothetical protein
MKFIWFIFTLFLLIQLTGCSENEANTEEYNKDISDQNNVEIPDSIKKDFDKHLTYTLQGIFQLNPQENYTKTILETDYNGDGIVDKIITINRLEKANLDLKNDDNPAKMLEMGQMGNYNHFILYNGKDSSFFSPVLVPSSPYLGLEVTSINLKNNLKSEIQVDYRIRNAAYRSIYTIRNNQAKMIFQWKLFDGLGSEEDEAYHIEIAQTGKTSEFKDLIIYKAELEKLPKNESPNTFKPKVSKKEGVFTTFFYLEKEGKYFTLPKN